MEALIPTTALLWMILSLIVDISVYRNTANQLYRFVPACMKVGIILMLILLNWLLPAPPVIEDGNSLLLVLAIITAMGIPIDVAVWFFCDGYPSKRKTRIFVGGIAVFIVVGFICGFLADGNHYRKTSTGSYHHYTFTAYSGKMTEDLRLSEPEPECRFIIDAEEGVLELLVTDEDGRVLYSGTPDNHSEFSVNGSGTIMFTITTHNFTGRLNADRIQPEIIAPKETEGNP